MNDRYEECELGRDVTHLFKSDKRKTTAIISVSLDHGDIARLAGIGRESGKTVAQVIRDAIAAYRVDKPAAPVQLNVVSGTAKLGLGNNPDTELPTV